VERVFNVIYTDILKLKRAKIIWVLVAVVLLLHSITFADLYNMYTNRGVIVDWNRSIANTALFINVMLGVPMISIVVGYIFSREYSENTINTLFTYPISRTKFIISKFVIIYILILMTFIICYVLSIIVGIMIPHEPFTTEIFIKYLKVYLLMSVMHFALIPPISLAAIFSKNIIPAICMAVGAVFIGAFALQTKYAEIFPWSIPTVVTEKVIFGENLLFTKEAISLSLTFTIFMAALLICVKRADIHCGS
jgi:hypothetical protein